jgi:hypothetical protein
MYFMLAINVFNFISLFPSDMISPLRCKLYAKSFWEVCSRLFKRLLMSRYCCVFPIQAFPQLCCWTQLLPKPISSTSSCQSFLRLLCDVLHFFFFYFNRVSTYKYCLKLSVKCVFLLWY